MDQLLETSDVTQVLWPYFLAPIAIVIAAYIGFRGILMTLRESRQQIKDRATINYLQNRNKDKWLSECMDVIYKIDRDRTIDIRKFAEIGERASDSAVKMRYVLNQHEYLSVGVRNNSFNEQMLKDAIYTTSLKLFERTEPLIQVTRDRRPKAYIEFEWLIDKWKKEGIEKPEVKKSWFDRFLFWKN